MTDPVTADNIYLWPLTPESIIKILELHQIDAVLPTMGGQTALNLAVESDKQGIWEKYNVRMIGVDIAAIELAEDREQFRNHVKTLGMLTPPS
jgi:carbamoyl-phosphate synthase large subunit